MKDKESVNVILSLLVFIGAATLHLANTELKELRAHQCDTTMNVKKIKSRDF